MDVTSSSKSVGLVTFLTKRASYRCIKVECLTMNLSPQKSEASLCAPGSIVKEDISPLFNTRFAHSKSDHQNLTVNEIRNKQNATS